MLTLLEAYRQIIIDIILSPFYWGAILLVAYQFFQMGKLERSILGHNKSSLYQRVLRSSILGVLGGSIGSLLVIGLGISINHKDFIYLIVVALFLMVLRQRFVCFAYGGGLLSLLSLGFGYPRVDIPSMMAMIALLHLVEGLLVYIDGARTKVPIFIELDNRTVGGFSMMSFWPIPFMIMMTVGKDLTRTTMPLWQGWPLFHGASLSSSMPKLSYLFGGFMAILGYSDMAIASPPKVRSRKTAKLLFMYSSGLLIGAIFSVRLKAFQYIMAIFAPLGHEVMIRLSRRTELSGVPRYRWCEKGVKVLDVVPKGVGAKLGLKTGDVLLAMNGKKINTKEEIEGLLSSRPRGIYIDYFDALKQKKVTRTVTGRRQGISALNILIVPKSSLYAFDISNDKGLFPLLIEKIRSRKKVRMNR